ncbi:hypothetical protein CTEN210_01362 [Chaetoceros tenuissimus]|uniref:MYND-type domain-containing protein n=1 Tax=Chaetoceros tenuissimus TaxID=426638 RepID=A0AAD3CEZ3_9STRA|nr:hypothetical protein CTEN210_01362 [Chaetoceros tenuissimus]
MTSCGAKIRKKREKRKAREQQKSLMAHVQPATRKEQCSDAPLVVTGVDVFFCNRDCQVKLWKTHRTVCGKVTTTDLKKEVSSANSEAKGEGKKELRDIDLCGNCNSIAGADNGFKLSACSKCSQTFYCSRKCQVEHWPIHKHLCRQNCDADKRIERSLDPSGMNVHNLLMKWIAKSSMLTCTTNVAFYALKRKGMEQQPPVKAVIMDLEFNYNAQTFILAEVPRTVAIADLKQEHEETLRQIFKDEQERIDGKGIDQSYIQFVMITTKELEGGCESNMAIVITKSALDRRANIDMDEIRNRFAQVRLKSDLFRGWKSIRRNNLQKQIEQMNLGHSYTAFVQSALQFFCSKSQQKTHRIIVDVRMGKEIGRISQLLGYKVVPVAGFKKYQEEIENFVIRVEDIESQQLPCTELAIETLFVDVDICFAFEYTAFCGVSGMYNKTTKQCKKAADKHFRKLQREVKEMPSDLLEKMSL